MSKCRECGKKIGYWEASRYDRLCSDCRIIINKAGLKNITLQGGMR